MVFSSAEFIFAFAPVALLVALALRARGARAGMALWLTGMSWVFYGYWEPRYLPILLVSLGVNFGLGSLLSARGKYARGSASLLWLGLVFNLGLLGYYKYANFAVDVYNAASGSSVELRAIALPIGISFFTFQQIAYLVDSQRGWARDRNFLRYALFVSFFPQLIAGPIVHHAEMMPQFDGASGRRRTLDLSVGATQFILGFAKKVLFADQLALCADAVFDGAASGAAIPLVEAWLGALCYSLQIYFDFSGYSDMAIGLGRMLGIRLPVNFASPYKAVSLSDFWRRWHITLSRFLRDYVYIPLGGNRHGAARRYGNLLLTMLLGGIWHGAGWTFVLWGALHGGLLALEQVASTWLRSVGIRIPRAAGRIATALCVLVAWVPFRAQDLATAGRMYTGMVGGSGLVGRPAPDSLRAALGGGVPIAIEDFQMDYPIAAALVLGLGAIAAFGPNSQQLLASYRPALASPGYPATRTTNTKPILRWRPTWPVGLLVAGVFVWSVYEIRVQAPFIYFQF